MSLCVQLLAYDSVKTFLTPKNGEPSRLPVPASTIAGATAGVCSTLTMYPLELLKTRLTVEVHSTTLSAFTFATIVMLQVVTDFIPNFLLLSAAWHVRQPVARVFEDL